MDSRKSVPREPLALVSFADLQASEALANAIGALGHKVHRVDSNAWLESSCDGRCTVLQLGDVPYPRERLLAFLRRGDAPRVLGAFSSGAAAGDEELFGACVDFLGWPCHPSELALRIGRLLHATNPAARDPVEADVLDECLPHQMLGRSPVLQKAIGILRKFARCDATVLIEGETGTGKELAARAIHYVGARRDHPFIAVNCGAIPDSLLASEFFGHERGAYTDARERRPGLIEQARRGTLFFDEVDALTEQGQVVLLRFLQEREFRPLGSHGMRKSEARIVAASNVDLGALVQQGRFRRDLAFRLQVLTVTLPPLREREGDVALLADHFLRLYAARYGQGLKTLDPETLAWMVADTWEGNVRALENMLHRYYLLTEDPVIRIPSQRASHDSDPSLSEALKELRFREAKARAVAAFERDFLSASLSRAGGNISLAARRAGKDRSAFRRLLHKHGLQN